MPHSRPFRGLVALHGCLRARSIIHRCLYIFNCLYVHIHASVYIITIERERERERERESETPYTTGDHVAARILQLPHCIHPPKATSLIITF